MSCSALPDPLDAPRRAPGAGLARAELEVEAEALRGLGKLGLVRFTPAWAEDSLNVGALRLAGVDMAMRESCCDGKPTRLAMMRRCSPNLDGHFAARAPESSRAMTKTFETPFVTRFQLQDKHREQRQGASMRHGSMLREANAHRTLHILPLSTPPSPSAWQPFPFPDPVGGYTL